MGKKKKKKNYKKKEKDRKEVGGTERRCLGFLLTSKFFRIDRSDRVRDSFLLFFLFLFFYFSFYCSNSKIGERTEKWRVEND